MTVMITVVELMAENLRAMRMHFMVFLEQATRLILEAKLQQLLLQYAFVSPSKFSLWVTPFARIRKRWQQLE